MSDLTIALPILETFWTPDVRRLQQDSLADLITLSGDGQIVLPQLGCPSFSVLKRPEDHPLIRPLWLRSRTGREQHKKARKRQLLIVTLDAKRYLETTTTDLRSSEDPLVCRNAERIAAGDAAQHLEAEVRKLLLLANLLRPGSISADKGWILCDDRVVRRSEGFYADHLYEAVEAAKVANWPVFQDIRLRDAWLWLESADCIASGIGRGPLGRAWAALSHTIKAAPQDDPTQLLWVLMALEALYTKSTAGIKEQLVSRTELLLGDRKKNKKDFGSLYDYRSRLLHGDVDIPVQGSWLYERTDPFAELYRHQGLALAVLIATLQLMVSRSWAEIQFTLSVSGVPATSPMPVK